MALELLVADRPSLEARLTELQSQVTEMEGMQAELARAKELVRGVGAGERGRGVGAVRVTGVSSTNRPASGRPASGGICAVDCGGPAR